MKAGGRGLQEGCDKEDKREHIHSKYKHTSTGEPLYKGHSQLRTPL